MPDTAQDFFSALTESGLMSADEVRSALSQFKPQEREDSQAIAQAFFARGKLTAYQAKELLAGRIAGLVLGNYVILDRLGAGGMGVVFKAQHRRMKRICALKMLPQHVVHSEEARKRFLREVEAAARLEHTNIVTAYDADEANGTCFLAMQYVEGSDLAHYVRRCGKLSIRKAIDYTLQAARGLQYAHQKGVIHRDIKPGNLLLDTEGVVRVLDMGLARLEQQPGDEPSAFQTHDELTGTGRVIGTVDYMAPEQTLDAKHVDRRADIYSLGCTLHFLLTGRSPVPDGSLTEKLLWHESAPVPSLSDVRPDVPPELNVVFRRMMARKPRDRYNALAEAIPELELCLSRLAEEHEATLDNGQARQGLQDVDTVAVVIPELVSEPALERVSKPSSSPSASSEPPASSDTRHAQLHRDATVVEQAAQHGKARRREQKMAIPAIAIGVCLVAALVVVMVLNVESGRSRSGWNEYAKSAVEQVLTTGVKRSAGRQLYSEMDTALESGREGDWRVGGGLTTDGKPYAFSVRGSRIESKPMTAQQALESGLNETSLQSSLENSFPHRTQPLVMLAQPELHVTTDQTGATRLQGKVFCTVSAKKTVEDAALIIERRSQQGGAFQTQATFHRLDDWRRLTPGWIYIDVEAPSPVPQIGDVFELGLLGFLQEPQPSLYRLSNAPTCAITESAPAALP